MTLITSFVSYAILLVILSALRNRLVFEFMGSSMLLFGNPKIGLWLYSILFLPGTILHELSHWLMAEILQVRTGAINILPDLDAEGDTKRLGSVATAHSGPFRAFLIGVAPFITGMLTLSLLGYFLFLGGLSAWQYVLLIYGIAVVGSSMLLSREDRRTWPFIVIFSLIISFLIYQLDLNLASSFFSGVNSALISLNKVLVLTSGVLLGIIGLLYVLRRIIEKLMHKKVVRG